MFDLRRFTGREMRLGDKLLEFNWGFLLLLTVISSMGFAMLYSVADGSFSPWAMKQMIRFVLGVGIMIVVAVIDLRLWMRIAYPMYAIALALVAAVDIVGFKGMGAQRWLNLGIIQIQPSEIMKVAILLALARYFHGLTLEETSRIKNLIVPLLLVVVPVGLVVKQPDLGTAILLTVSGVVLFFAAGLAWRYFIFGGAAVLAAIPVIWDRLHDYQRNRVFTFLDPERDPLGAGYHILQSKIALGSGGVFGKGFMAGTQAHLNFLPEKADRLHLHDVERGAWLRRRVDAARLLFGGADLLFQRRHTVPQPVRPSAGAGHRRDVLLLCLHQYRDGDGASSGGRRAAAPRVLWRHGHAVADVRLRSADERLYPQERRNRPQPQRLLVGAGPRGGGPEKAEIRAGEERR